MSFTQENTVDLQSKDRVATTVRRKHTDSVKNISHLKLQDVFLNKYWAPFATCFLSNTPKVKYKHSSNNTERSRKYLTRTNYESTSGQSFCNCNISVTGHTKGGSRLSPAQTTGKDNRKFHNHKPR